MPYDEGACPGPCNRRYREAIDQYDAEVETYRLLLGLWAGEPPAKRGNPPARPERPSVNPVLGDPTWSGRCCSLIRAALTELDDLASLLAASSDGHRGGPSRGAQKTGHVGKGSSAPTLSPITDTLDELYGALVTVEDDWRAFRAYPVRPQRARTGHARRVSITFLLDELDAILLHPGSVQFGRATLAWQRRLRGLTKSDPVGAQSPIRCPRCGERGRVRREDDGYFRCHACERLMSQDEHDEEFDRQALAQEAADLAVEGAAP
ncbi:TFIIB-type zinc ribbon-containing protein [Sphaerisporangium sp. NPDC051011]|uniref:TFIIB-type zinc ribbon-containing protein n=1 Tax=Sphaerisporangium sp. NPDC051011 TaxID=3155792 RepID=UPI0033D01E15